MKTKFLSATLCIASLAFFASCNPDSEYIKPVYNVPETYEFENVDHVEASARVQMLNAINKYAGSTHAGSSQIALDQTTANNLWNNTNNPYPDAWVNTSGVKLTDILSDASTYKTYLDELVAISKQPLTLASSGNAGYLERNSNKIYVNQKGVEYVQAIQKGSMSAAFFKEAMKLLGEVPTADNSTVTPGKGTEMAHKFDLAFGYLGVPANYEPTEEFAASNKANLLFWGGYLAERGKTIEAGKHIFDAFRTGRAAIVAKDYQEVRTQIAIIKEYWEKLAAAALWNYVVAPQSGSSLGSRLHQVSEGFGFAVALKHRPADSKLSQPAYQEIEDILSGNLYDLLNDASFTKLNRVKELLNAAYGEVYKITN